MSVEQATVNLIAAAMQEAIDIVATATGTRRSSIFVTFDGIDGVYGWTVTTHVLTFATPKGRVSRSMQVRGWSSISPNDAALGCVQDIERAVAGGREIAGGRIEIMR